MDRDERDMDSNRTLLSEYQEEIVGLETPGESLKHTVAIFSTINISKIMRYAGTKAIHNTS